MNCLLCHTTATSERDEAFFCTNCGLVFKNPIVHLNPAEDLKRYSEHQNNEKDQGYLDFLSKLTNPLAQFLPAQFNALDFGCGPGPALSMLLEKMGGAVENYDPIFYPKEDLLNNIYDVVTTTEVVEHFKNPLGDWTLLISRVRPGGLLGVMTQFINPGIDYRSWWYKNDPTHVVFYQEKTFNFLADKFNLEVLFNDRKSVVIFKKKHEGQI